MIRRSMLAATRALTLAAVFGAQALGAQTLSSPLGTSTAVPGQGSGYHSPQSAFPPLVARADVVPWSVLGEVSVKFLKQRIVTTYSPDVLRLNASTVKVQGYMTPLEPGMQHRHFLLLSVPPTCPFCVPGGAESMIEVRTAEPVKYSQNAVVLQGRFQVLEQDPQGLYYRMTGARVVK